MIELRFLRNLLPTIDETGQVVSYRHGEDILQYRYKLSEDELLGVQTQGDADLAIEYEKWKDVHVVVEINKDLT